MKDELAAEMEKASAALDFERAAVYRDRLAALSAIQSHQGINPRGVEEADVFAVAPGRRLHLRRGVLLPHRPELGQPRLFPQGRPLARAGRGAGRVPGAVLRRQAVPALRLPLARHRGSRAARRGADRQERPQGRGRGAAARREEGAGRPRARQCARGARPQARRHLLAAQAARRARRDLRPAAHRRGASRSTTTATSRARTRSAP